MAPPVSIILAFRVPLLAIGIRTVLAAHAGIHVVAECSTLAATVRALKKHQPQVLVAGTALCAGQPAGIELLAQASPGTRLAVFCVHDEVPEHALLQGASAVLPPECGPDHLIDCIHVLAAGRRWRAPANLHTSDRRPSGSRTATTTILGALSVRERQIAHAVATGKRNKEIAEAFGISAGTVKLHLNRIYSKVGVSGRLALLKKLFSEANFPL